VVATHDEALARASGLQVRRISCRRDADGGVTATLGEAC
jgi:putative ABC transport system ATP-binding protein